MKKITFLSLIIALIIGSCTQGKRSPIEGAWQNVYGKVVSKDTIINYLSTLKDHYMKIIGKKYFTTIWQDTIINKTNWWYSGFNGGTYTFQNGIYTEQELYFSIPSNIGNKVAFKAEIKDDTLILTGIPLKGYENVTYVEKLKRLK